MAGSAVTRLAAGLLGLAALPSFAGDPASYGYLQIDNDVLFHTDRWYTSGVRAALVTPRAGYELEWGVLQEIYTPEAKRYNPIDRPPAARLLGSLARHDRDESSWRTIEVDVGVAGPSALGRQTQELIHRLIRGPHEPWEQQRNDELDAQLAVAQTLTLPFLRTDWERLKTNFGAVAGTELGFAHAGLEWRVGRGAAATISSPALRFVATPPRAASPVTSGWNAFVAADVRGVWRNRLLDRTADYEYLGTLERKSSVTRASTGGAWVSHWATVTLAVVYDTREFVGQRRGQGFGSLTIDFPF